MFRYRLQGVEGSLVASERAFCDALGVASCVVLVVGVPGRSGTSGVASVVMLFRCVSSLTDRFAGSWCCVGCVHCFTFRAWIILSGRVVRLG